MNRLQLILTVLFALAWMPHASADKKKPDSVVTHTVFFQEFSWSPDGSQIVFSAAVDQKPAEIHAMTLQTKAVTQLTRNDAWDYWTCWSKDGTLVYFASNRDGTDQIYSMRADGSQQIRHRSTTSKDMAPAISPDGSKIAFVSDRDGANDIYIMGVDDARVERITSTPGREYNPQWSPDGGHLAYSLETGDGKDQVYVLDVSDGTTRQISESESLNTFPTWSVDGLSVIYCSSPAKDEEFIVSAALDGSKRSKILPLEAFFARYSPDGKQIGYIAGNWPSSNIYVIDYSEGTLRCLTCDLTLDTK